MLSSKSGRAGGFPGRLRDAGVRETDLGSLADEAGTTVDSLVQPGPIRRPGCPEGVSVRILRDVLVVLGVLAISVSAVSAQSPAAPAGEWPQFRGTRELTGISNATVPEELQLLWTYEAGESIDSSAAIFDGASTWVPTPVS